MINKCTHQLSDILFIALCTLICNGEDFEDMELFGNLNKDWLDELLELPKGIPSHDTFNRVLQRIEPKELSIVLEKDGKYLLESIKQKQIVFDGKKLKGVSPKSKGNKGTYILSAWVSENKICVGQQKVGDKSNEIKAIPELIESIDIKEAVVSIDAIGCQKKIASLIKSKKGDYLLALKKNQKETFSQVEEAFRFHKPEQHHLLKDNNHGRKESRTCSIIEVSDLPKDEIPIGWESLNTLVRIESERIIENKKQCEVRYYISSEKGKNPAYYNALVRGHWGIENQLHWHLDVTFNEDGCRARSGNAPLNLNIIRKLALQRINLMDDNLSMKKRRYKASMDITYLREMLKI